MRKKIFKKKAGMKKILFITNIPAPYRIDFFNCFGKSCDLTVAFERKKATDRDDKWKGHKAENFTEVYANVKPYRHEQSKGNGFVKLIREKAYDIIIFSGYGSPSVRRAIAYCRHKKIPYYIEYDGAFNKKDIIHKYLAKKYLVKEARGHFITCRELEDYLTRLDVPKERLLKYPFSSLNESDILSVPLSPEEKKLLKAELGIHSSCAILSVGQFIPRKGFDILMRAMAAMKHDCAVYIVGGKPPLKYEQLKEKLGLNNLHFVNFLSKEELKRWYQACDIFVLPTREDIWGLVINEAMANGLPVIATDHCIAALELIEAGKNGYIVPVEDITVLAEKLDVLAEASELRAHMGEANLQKIRAYTIESMAKKHEDYLALNVKEQSWVPDTSPTDQDSEKTPGEMISVIMSTYNEPISYVRDAVDSILNQTYKNIEFIIILDSLENIAVIESITQYAERDQRIKIIKNEKNVGLTESLNRGLAIAKGTYIARMDADDVSYPDRLEKELFFLNEGGYDLVGARINRMDSDGCVYEKDCHIGHSDTLMKRLRYIQCVPHPTWLVKKEVYNALEGYRNYHRCEDYDFLLRTLKAGYKIGCYDKALLNYRMFYRESIQMQFLKTFLSTQYLRSHYRKIEQITPEEVEKKKLAHISAKESKAFAYACEIHNEAKKYRKTHKIKYGKALIKAIFTSKYFLSVCVKVGRMKLLLKE